MLTWYAPPTSMMSTRMQPACTVPKDKITSSFSDAAGQALQDTLTHEVNSHDKCKASPRLCRAMHRNAEMHKKTEQKQPVKPNPAPCERADRS